MSQGRVSSEIRGLRFFSFCVGRFLVAGSVGLHGPDVPLNVASICSSVLPFVSGMKAMVKMTLTMHIEANNQKVPALVRRFWKRQLYRHGCSDGGKVIKESFTIHTKTHTKATAPRHGLFFNQIICLI